MDLRSIDDDFSPGLNLKGARRVCCVCGYPPTLTERPNRPFDLRSTLKVLRIQSDVHLFEQFVFCFYYSWRVSRRFGWTVRTGGWEGCSTKSSRGALTHRAARFRVQGVGCRVWGVGCRV